MDQFGQGPVGLAAADAVDSAAAEIDIAIELVDRGVARRVTISGLRALLEAAGVGAAHAQAAGLAFRADPGPPPRIVIGPRRPARLPTPDDRE